MCAKSSQIESVYWGTLFIYICFFKDFFMWTIFKVVIEFVTILLLFYVFYFGHKAWGILAP